MNTDATILRAVAGSLLQALEQNKTAVTSLACWGRDGFEILRDQLSSYGLGLPTRVFDVSSDPLEPWAPFGTWALASPASDHAVYPRHRALFDLEPVSSCLVEPLIDEELPYERSRLADALLDRLALPSGPQGWVLLRHAEWLSPEAWYVVERLRSRRSHPLVLVLCFESAPTDSAAFDRLDTLGEILGTTAWNPDTVGASRSALKPSDQQLEQLMRWQCFETVAQTTEVENTPQAFEALACLGKFEVAIDRCETYLRQHRHAESITLLSVWRSLARLYRQAGDAASAARYLALGWKRAHETSDLPAQAHFDFLVFETGYRTLAGEDVSLGLEDRLLKELRELNWRNLQAYVLTRNVWIQTVGRTQGWPVAWKLWRQGAALARTLGNQRRMSVALQTQGSLLAVGGHLLAARRSTRRALVLARRHSNPLHLARVENGLGYQEFLCGSYKKAWSHHVRALEILPQANDHHEYIGTLVNLGRLYLFNNQPELAVPLLSKVVETMDGLSVADLPFHPRYNTYALLGIGCLKLGKVERALSFLDKVREDEIRLGRLSEHRAFLELLIADVLGDPESADRIIEETERYLVARQGDLRHFLVWILVERARERWVRGDSERTQILLARAETHLAPPPLGRDERRLMKAVLAPPIRDWQLPPVHWDSPLVLRFAQQEAALRHLRRLAWGDGFLQGWHQTLVPGLAPQQLYPLATALLKNCFPIEGAAVLAADQPQILSASPGSDLEALRAAAERGSTGSSDHCWLIPVVHSAEVQARLLLLDNPTLPALHESDRRVLELAAGHLALLLLNQKKTQELEERGIHLATALEVLKDTQERLVRSETLGVLGHLAAGLAHELNTPLGAIESAARSLGGFFASSLGAVFERAGPWGEWEWQCLRALFERIAQAPVHLGASHRSQRKQLSENLAREGLDNAEVLADLWCEAGLATATDLHLAWGRDVRVAGVLEVVEFLSQGIRSSRVIELSVRRASAVVGSLRNYLVGSTGESTTSFDLERALRETVELLGVDQHAGTKVVWEVPLALIISGRRWSLEQVWTNIIQNAVQAMEGRGTLTVRAERDDRTCTVEFIDTGPGIPATDLDAIFRPFYSTKKASGGLGLGLDISRRIVEAHQGRLTVDSRPGRTVFRVALPTASEFSYKEQAQKGKNHSPP